MRIFLGLLLVDGLWAQGLPLGGIPIGSGGGGTPTWVQSGAATNTLSAAITPATGHRVGLLFSWGSTTAPTSCTDNASGGSNAYELNYKIDATNVQGVGICTANVTNGGGLALTITANITGAPPGEAIAFEYSNVASVSAQDGTTNAGNVATTTTTANGTTCGAITTTANGDLILSGIADTQEVPSVTNFAAGTSPITFTRRINLNTSGTNTIDLALEDGIQASSGSITPAWTASSLETSARYACVSVAFKHN